METMKRNRRRLAINLLTIIAMVFTLILCMGTDVVEAASPPFTGFRAEYIAGVSGESVELKYDSYNGSGDPYGDNIFLRENPSTGTIRMVGDTTIFKYSQDFQFTPATHYIYSLRLPHIIFTM